VSQIIQQWKPAAPAKTHLLLAGLLWTCVGAGLTFAGVGWSARAGFAWGPVLVAAGGVAGVAKARFVLDRTALSSAARIRLRGDGKCLGGFLSWQSWMLVLAMIAGGIALRRSGLPRPLLGFLYTAVGTALLWSSRVYWAEWRVRR